MRYFLAVLLIFGCESPSPKPILDAGVKVQTVETDAKPWLRWGPLPDICKPWKPGPPSVIEKNPNWKIPGERMDRMRCSSDGLCDSFASLNSWRFQADHLWLKGPDNVRTPNGGGGNCKVPETADVVQCQAEVNDRDWNTVEKVLYTCRGDRLCNETTSLDCCKVVKRENVFIPFKEPTSEQKAKWEKERCDDLLKRKRTCEKFCIEPGYEGQCMPAWRVTCD